MPTKHLKESKINDIKRGDSLDITDKILALKEKENIAVLAHNYQSPEVQDIADFLGDSLDLCYRARELDNEIIVFAGVRFMAESAKILNPEKTVLLPAYDAYCPMASMLTPDIIMEQKKLHPGVPLVLYGNTNASSKALADVICTSANAVKIVESLDADTILFGPDKNLRSYAASRTGKTLLPVPDNGYCYVHNDLITPEAVAQLKEEHPESPVLVHPECRPEVQAMADAIVSTNGMIAYAKKSSAQSFIIGTEKELCYRLEKDVPGKKCYPIEGAVCEDMKKTTLEDILAVMSARSNELTLDEGIICAAQKPLERMLEMSR